MSSCVHFVNKPANCLVFHSCNAPICPLDAAWRKAVHLSSEPVCRYLLASGKAGVAEHYQDDPTFAAVLEHKAEVCARHRDIARRVARAAGSPIQNAWRKGIRPGQKASGGRTPAGEALETDSGAARGPIPLACTPPERILDDRPAPPGAVDGGLSRIAATAEGGVS
jgi:hypothetical protein